MKSWIPAFAPDCPGNKNRLFYLYRNQLNLVMRGLDPPIHALAIAASAWADNMDARGTSPWAKGPRIKSGHDDFELCNDRCILRSARIGNFPGQPCTFAGMTPKV
jgi:hypothetical protein